MSVDVHSSDVLESDPLHADVYVRTEENHGSRPGVVGDNSTGEEVEDGRIEVTKGDGK